MKNLSLIFAIISIACFIVVAILYIVRLRLQLKVNKHEIERLKCLANIDRIEREIKENNDRIKELQGKTPVTLKDTGAFINDKITVKDYVVNVTNQNKTTNQ